MILSFKHKGLENFYRTGSTAKIQAQHKERLRLILGRLNVAIVPKDVDAPGLHLHALKGELKGRWAVTVRANWRVTFQFVGADVELLDYEDYH